MKAKALLLLIPCIALLACSRAETPPVTPPGPTNPPSESAASPATANATPTAARVTLSGTPVNAPAAGNVGNGVGGTLQLVATTGAVQLAGEVTGLPPNAEHGFHVHQNGDCSGAGFAAAGEHFNPDGTMHGAPTSASHHLGDIASLKPDAKGIAVVSATIPDATLNDAGPHDLVGKALILHAKPDDYKTQPSGNSGDRIACGVIERVP